MFKEYQLKNNLTVIYERWTQLHSVAFGVWIGAGSRYETIYNNGVSHFIEHMVFKGTETRTARQIACEFDKLGGQVNAFTGKDCTCYYTKTLDTDLEPAVELLSDMLFHSVFNSVHIETEKKVVYEEINMYEDDPEELVNDILTEEVWRDWSLGYPILGTRKSIRHISRDSILEYLGRYYVPDNCVISVVGNFDESELHDIINRYFGSWQPLNYCPLNQSNLNFRRGHFYRKKDIEQTHICIGFNGISMGDGHSCDLLVLNNIMGGSMSSRLFQNIREDRGLVYSIYSFPSSFRDVGMFSIYAAVNPDQAVEVIEIIREELYRFCENGITEAELVSGRNQLKTNYILGFDNATDRMTSLGKYKLIAGVVKSTKEVLERIEDVNTDRIMNLTRTVICSHGAGIAVLGPAEIPASVLESFNMKNA